MRVWDFKTFLDALQVSGCSKRLATLSFFECDLGAQDVCALADLIGQDCLPALKELCLSFNPNIADVGVVAPAEALLKPTETCLEEVELSYVGMGDEGIAALASLVYRGRMEDLTSLSISRNENVTDQGVNALAQAIDARGLPLLRGFGVSKLATDMTVLEIRTIVGTVLSRCPQLTEIHLGEENGGHRDAVTSMLEEAERAGKVRVHFPRDGL